MKQSDYQQQSAIIVNGQTKKLAALFYFILRREQW
jgi:hypothetical protein